MSQALSSQSIRYLRWIADRNPFYLLSACCGLLGCWLLGDIGSADIANVGIRIGGEVAYQAVVVLLALWLSRNDKTERDAAILSVLTFVLATDFSFFFTQSAMLAPLPAGLFALFGAAQSLAISGFLIRGLHVRISEPAQWLLGMDLTAVHVMPLAIRFLVTDTPPSPALFLGVFAVAGGLVAAHAWPRHWRVAEPGDDMSSSVNHPLSRGMAVAAPVVALVSVVAHVFAVKWVYQVQFISVFLSPLFLGAAAVCVRVEIRRTEALRTQAPAVDPVSAFAPGGLAGTLAILAVFLALGNSGQVAVWDVAGGSWFGIGPLRLTVLGAAAIFWKLWRIWELGSLLAIVCGALGLMILGHTPGIMLRHVRDLVRLIDSLLVAAMPTSRTGWGVSLFAAAFLLLAAGASLSWWITRPVNQSDDTGGDSGP